MLLQSRGRREEEPQKLKRPPHSPGTTPTNPSALNETISFSFTDSAKPGVNLCNSFLFALSFLFHFPPFLLSRSLKKFSYSLKKAHVFFSFMAQERCSGAPRSAAQVRRTLQQCTEPQSKDLVSSPSSALQPGSLLPQGLCTSPARHLGSFPTTFRLQRKCPLREAPPLPHPLSLPLPPSQCRAQPATMLDICLFPL